MNDLSSWIETHARFQPGKPAILYQQETWSYEELDRHIKDLARALKNSLGAGRGDRIAYLGLNSPLSIALLFACARLGCIFQPMNWRLAVPEQTYVLRNASTKFLICEQEFASVAEACVVGLSDCALVAGDFSPQSGTDWLRLDDLIAGAVGSDSNPHVDLELPLLLVYTSGTTGHPKGALLKQEALLCNALNSLHMHEMTSTDLVLTALPLFHVGGLNIQTTPALYAGATIVLLPKFDPTQVLEAIKNRQPTLLVLIPATMAAVISHPQWQSTSLDSLRVLTTGSSIVPLGLIEKFHERGVPVIQVYGSTETAPVAVYQRRQDAFEGLGSVGRPGLHSKIKIVDDDGQDVSPGKKGELLVKGKNLMYEYWGDPESTCQAIRDGWFCTGDIGYQDEIGFIHICDRKKDMIISGGENIYPAELETLLHEMPGVVEAAVVGRADDRWGEVAVAYLVKEAAAEIDIAKVMDYFDGRLARYKHPKEVIFIDQLPRNVMGKILKQDLRDLMVTSTKATKPILSESV